MKGINLTTWLAVGLALLFTARLAFGQETGLPELLTLSAQEQVAGIAQPGDSYPVVGLRVLAGGHHFAQVLVKGKKYWLQLEKGMTVKVGETLRVERPAYLFKQPVVESVEVGSEKKTAEEVFSTNTTSRHPFDPKALGVNKNCTRFINERGEFGNWGAYLMNRINPQEHPQLFADHYADLDMVCPRFREMNEADKKNFWVWLIASMANFESSCNERVKAQGVNGIAAGLLQLHLGKEYAYGCRRGMDSLDGVQNLECGLTILGRDLARTGKIFPSNKNYWQVLRPQSKPGQKTLRVAREYKPCF